MNLGPVEVLITLVLFPLLTALALYWVVRLAVRHGVTDAHRRLRDEERSSA